jgi:hypothetical protein
LFLRTIVEHDDNISTHMLRASLSLSRASFARPSLFLRSRSPSPLSLPISTRPPSTTPQQQHTRLMASNEEKAAAAAAP